MIKFFKIKKKKFGGVIFAQTEFFLKTLCLTVEVLQHVNVKDAEYTGCRTKIIRSLSTCKNCLINLLNSLNHL